MTPHKSPPARAWLVTNGIGGYASGPVRTLRRSVYFGDLRARDAAYHQGAVWGWLIGSFIAAWLKVHPDEPSAARKFLVAMPVHLRVAGLGSISEFFDAEAPHHARGCIAQAWSVAEVCAAGSRRRRDRRVTAL